MHPDVQLQNRRILIIDDNRSIHDDFIKILAPRSGDGSFDQARAHFFGETAETDQPAFEIDSAFQGEEGVALLRRALDEGRPYAMAYVDVRMPPGIDGIETIARLWQHDSALQVVVCTAYSDYSWREMVAQLGHSDRLLILKKPFDTVEVLQLAHALTDKWALSQALARQLVALQVDVTAANGQLREQAALLDKAQDAILVRKLDDTITFWNASAERLYGWTAAEAVGRKESELLYAGESAFAAASAIVSEKGAWIGELRQQTKDGRPVVVEGHWTLVRDEAGEPKSVLAINTDVTEKKKLEAQFLRAQRMESIGVLAGGIAHDLNNVLGPIMMALDILRVRFPDAEGEQMIQILKSCAERGAGMVRQVLQFARGDKGERMSVQPGYVVRELQSVARDTFPKMIDVKVDAAADLWTIAADPTQIHQVLMNLCVNARDAMPSGGVLTLTAENVLLDAGYASMILHGRPGRYVCLQVIDTGTGMPPEVVARIFEPFFTTKPMGHGTGLGLSTAIGIVESHGGFVEVKSKPGQGTQFKVYLPAEVEKAATLEPAPARKMARGQGELILIVDDEAAHRAIMGDVLTSYGYRVLTASDGAEACALYAMRKPEVDLVLTDLLMPIMDGAATVRALKCINGALPIIVATGESAPGHLALAREAGADAFLAKPYCTEKLLSMLRDYLPETAGAAV